MITFDYIGGMGFRKKIDLITRGRGEIKILHYDISFSPIISIFYLNKGSSLQNICCKKEWVPV